MRFRFMQAVNLGGKNYKKGLHVLPLDVQKNGFFQKLLKAKLVLSADAEKTAAPPLALNERNKKLAEKLVAPKSKTKSSASSEPAPSTPETSDPVKEPEAPKGPTSEKEKKKG